MAARSRKLSVCIDNSLTDLVVVDPTTKRLARPWLTLAMDTSTRTTIGFHISFEPASSANIKHATTLAFCETTP